MSSYMQPMHPQQQQQQPPHPHHHHHHHHHRPPPSLQQPPSASSSSNGTHVQQPPPPPPLGSLPPQHPQQQQQQQRLHQPRYGRAVGQAGHPVGGPPVAPGRAGASALVGGGIIPPGDENMSLPSLDLTSSYLPLPTPSSRLPLTRPASPPTDAHPSLPEGEEEVDQQLANPSATEGNRGNKLKVGSRWVRKGKAVAWGMGFGEREAEDHLRSRLKLTLSHLPESLPFTSSSRSHSPSRSSSRSPSPPLLPHLSYPASPPPTSASLSALLQPPRSYTEVVLSPAMRYTFASGHLEDALGRTAGELIEGESHLSRALGLFFESNRERGIGKRKRQQGGSGSRESSAPPPPPSAPAVPPVQPTNPYDPLAPPPPPPHPTHPQHPLSALETQFLTPQGVDIQVPVVLPHPGQPMTPEQAQALANVQAGIQGVTMTTVRLGLEEQREQLYRGMDALGELLADSREYVERLEEVKARLAGVGRSRKRVWREVRERCLESGELGSEEED